MALIRIPCSLREHCGGQSEVRVEADDLAMALATLENRYPGCRDRIEDPAGGLRNSYACSSTTMRSSSTPPARCAWRQATRSASYLLSAAAESR